MSRAKVASEKGWSREAMIRLSAAVDLACWDIMGKAGEALMEQSVHETPTRAELRQQASLCTSRSAEARTFAVSWPALHGRRCVAVKSRLFGGFKDEVPCYATCGYYRHQLACELNLLE